MFSPTYYSSFFFHVLFSFDHLFLPCITIIHTFHLAHLRIFFGYFSHYDWYPDHYNGDETCWFYFPMCGGSVALPPISVESQLKFVKCLPTTFFSKSSIRKCFGSSACRIEVCEVWAHNILLLLFNQIFNVLSGEELIFGCQLKFAKRPQKYLYSFLSIKSMT